MLGDLNAFRYWPAVACVLSALLLAQFLAGSWRRRARRDRIVGRVLRAAKGERDAGAWLSDLGFVMLGAQVAADIHVCVDGEPRDVGVRADFLVERDGRRFVVEVKTGAVATRIQTAATRRQLLEYLVAFDVDGVLLVDMEARQLHEVTFPRLGRDALADRARDEGSTVVAWSGWIVSALFVLWLFFR